MDDEDDTLYVDEKNEDELVNEEEEEEDDEEENSGDDEDVEEDIEEDEEEDENEDDDDEFNETGEIDISDIYEEVFKVNKNVFNKNRKTDPPPVSKVKKTKKRKNIDYIRTISEPFRQNGMKLFSKYTTEKNSVIIDKIIYRLSTEYNCKTIEKNYMSLSRLTLYYLINNVKCKQFVPILKTAVYRGDWIIPDKWKDEKFRQDQITNNIENPPLPKSGVVRCPRCLHNPKLKDNENRGKKTDYYQKQTRSSDEPMTVFAYCYDCNYRWTF